MPKYRADFDVKASTVFPLNSPTLELHTYDSKYAISLRNAPVGDDGHVPNLVATVIGESENIDEAQYNLREVLAVRVLS